MWLSLVERLLWEQDAAGSNPVIRTTKREPSLVGGSLFVFCCRDGSAASCEQSKVLALGSETTTACGGTRESSEWLRSIADAAAVSARKISGTATGMPQVRILSSGPQKENRPLWAVLFLFSAAGMGLRHLANKARYLLWGARRPPPVAGQGSRASGCGR